MMSLLRIAIAQIDLAVGDRKANYGKVERMLSSKWVGSDIPTAVILPEIWDVGYVIEESHKYGDRMPPKPQNSWENLLLNTNVGLPGAPCLHLPIKALPTGRWLSTLQAIMSQATTRST